MHVSTESARMLRCMLLLLVPVGFRKQPMLVPRSQAHGISRETRTSRQVSNLPDTFFRRTFVTTLILSELHNILKLLW